MAPSTIPTDSDKPLIAIIGGTGAQGRPVIENLVRDGAYRVRVLTRDIKHRRAQALERLSPENVELVQGSALNEATVEQLFSGAYGAFVNLDGFAMGEKHIWGNLDYGQLKSGFKKEFRTGHYDGKGRVAQFMKSFPSPTPEGTTWSVLTSGPYLQMLSEFLSPIIANDGHGTRLFAAPLGPKGRVPMIDLEDLGWYARYMFDHPREFDGRNLEVASEHVGWQQLADIFTKVTGLPAKFVDLRLEDYLSIVDRDTPAGYNDRSTAQPGEDGPMSWHDNFKGFWSMWRANFTMRDYAELDRIHPTRVNLEAWMRRTGYDGTNQHVLKNVTDTKTRPIKTGVLLRSIFANVWKYLWYGLGDAGADGFRTALTTLIPRHLLDGSAATR